MARQRTLYEILEDHEIGLKRLKATLARGNKFSNPAINAPDLVVEGTVTGDWWSGNIQYLSTDDSNEWRHGIRGANDTGDEGNWFFEHYDGVDFQTWLEYDVVASAARHSANIHNFYPDGTGTTQYVRIQPASVDSHIIIFDDNPQIWFAEDGVTGAGKSYWFHQNSGSFYILSDRTVGGAPTDGAWDSPHPLQITTDGSFHLGHTLYLDTAADWIEFAGDAIIKRNGGTTILNAGVTYTNLYDPAGNTRIWLHLTDYYSNANTHHWRNTSSTELMRLDSAGDLHIAGDQILFDTIAGNDYLQLSESLNYFRVVVDGGERFRVDNSGYIHSAGRRIYFGVNSNDYIHQNDSTNQFQFVSDATTRFIIGHGAAAPGSDNAVDSGDASLRWDDVWATNGTIQTSDPSTKRNIADSNLGLDFIMRLRTIMYQREGGNRPHYGLDAAQVKQVLDELGQDFAGFIDPAYGSVRNISVDSINGPLGLRYSEFTGPLIKAVQELAGEVGVLRRKVKQLEKR